MSNRVGEFRHCKCSCYTNTLPEFCSGCNKEKFTGVVELTQEEKEAAKNGPEYPPEAFDDTHNKLWLPLTDEQIDQACDEAYPPSGEELERLGDNCSPEALKKAATQLRQEVWASALNRMKETGEVKITVHQPRNYRTSSQEPNMSNHCPDLNEINEQANQALALPPKILQGESNFASHAEDHLGYMSRSDDFPPVRTKRQFVKLYEQGVFGNRSPTWNTLPEFLASGYTGLIHLRNRIAGGLTWYNVAANDVDLYWQNALNTGLKPTDLYISGMCPTERTVLQGEVMQTAEGHLNLYYTRVKKPMRIALAEDSYTVVGSVAQKFLEFYLCPNSYEWLQILLTRYPFHCIEFTALNSNWGTLPGYNTLFWEVRLGY